MPLYFAYGSNMDEAALQRRCPKARALGLARLVRHRFVLMPNGYASVRRDPVSDVHGVLFDLALSDVRPLDRYEDVDRGLYTKVIQPVVRHKGLPVQALLYVGAAAGPSAGAGQGAAEAGYMAGVVAAARAVGLPPAYVAMLEGLAAPRPIGARLPRAVS